MKPNILLIAAAALCISCSVMCVKKPNLKNTSWKCVFQEFVADAGNATVTVTLDFVSAKEYVMNTKSEMPPYPAMYMNPDGTVDTMPGFSTEYSTKGTYSVDKDVITLTGEEGGPKTVRFSSGKLESDDLYYRHLEFTPETKL